MDTVEHVLLTGAGFTHNFGAPLAEGMWNLIVAHPALHALSSIRALLLDNLDYESAYYSVVSGDDYTAEEKEGLRKAVAAAYEHVDDTVRSWIFRADAPYPVNIYGVWKFLDRFAGTQTRPGLFFTLNQDLFVERHCASDPLRPAPWLPYLQRAARISGDPQTKLRPSPPIVLPSNLPSLAESIQGQRFLYVKLHGSSNWYTPDGSQRMVIGHHKADQISHEPLLARYFQLLETVLSSGRKRLLIAGYGFRDDHVNALISNAVGQGALEVFILSPQSAESLRGTLSSAPHGTGIWGGLRAHFPYTMLQLFPPSQDETPAWRHVCQAYFQSRERAV